MKTRIVVAGLLATVMVLEASAQQAEYDDMYFTGKDREKNKAINAKESTAFVKRKKQKTEEVTLKDNGNPTDSYSARNVNPEYISRSNSEQASEDEDNYYVEGYSSASDFNYNNSYYNNVNWARNSYYANSGWNSSYYGGGMGYYDPWMSPYYGGGMGYYDPWMMGSYGYPSYGMRSGWSVSIGYSWGNWGYPYYGGYNPYGGYAYAPYYGGNYEGSRANYGKRPSRHSAVVTPTQRTTSRTRTTSADNNSTNGRARTRQTQDEYYVRPSRRTSTFDNSSAVPSDNSGNIFSNPSSTPSRSRDLFNSPGTPRENRMPAYGPSPSRGNSDGNSGGSRGSSGGGGSSSPRPRGRN